MLYEYGHIGILVVIAIIFPLGAVVTSWALQHARIRPKAVPDKVRDDIYECGLRTEGPSLVQFNFRYYLVALVFVVFDVEVIFLYAWAVAYGDILVPGFVSVMVFLAILVLGYLYDWRKGGLEWR